MLAILKARGLLIFVLLVFVVLKIPHLFYPYYWDECWPYAVAIQDMYKHGISLMPSAMDPELSRGHPLFFHAAAAIWMNIFGNSHVSMHLFALSISVFFLIAIYEAGIRLFNQRVAILSTVLVATQVVFFVQSSFVLFEVLVAFLVFLSLYFYSRDKHILTAASLTALFFTKESGLVAGLVLGCHAFIALFYKKEALPIRLFRLSSVLVPCFLIGLFFLIQKYTRGWFIFPLHSNTEHRWPMFWYNFRMACLDAVIQRDNRYYYFILLLALSAVAAIKNKKIKYLIIFFPAVIIYYYANDMRAGRLMPSVPFFCLFIVSIMCMLYVFRRLNIYKNGSQERFIILSCAFIFCFCCFSAVTYFTPRYLLAAVVPLLFFAAVVLDQFIDQAYPLLFYPVLLTTLIIGYLTMQASVATGDVDLGAFNGMDVQQDVVNFLEKNNCYDQSIGTASFLEQQHLINPATGFLHSNRVFTNVRWFIDNKTEYAVFDNLEPDLRYAAVKNDSGFHLVHRYQKGLAWNEIFCRNAGVLRPIGDDR